MQLPLWAYDLPDCDEGEVTQFGLDAMGTKLQVWGAQTHLETSFGGMCEVYLIEWCNWFGMQRQAEG